MEVYNEYQYRILCDLRMALFQFSDRDDIEDKAFNTLIETMDAIEKFNIKASR
ncbi:hypothetical protein MCU_00868 [Bartonella elizabethae Re6043vi]|uniref:Uncharacterized protein n=2 Tax=Bartonella elizabethae TaxID=807 RepID=J1A4F5_BAREL|nr:hypothetical protein MCU_00868 [Bartonella elizabethae Re6043vi]EJF96558.1 hypothetical protein MEE_00457 [Bartonella elizabethae F9251 = ATCC 49927]VEJ39837.1 Uncharacterised protein [Bartonella elizabethae]